MIWTRLILHRGRVAAVAVAAPIIALAAMMLTPEPVNAGDHDALNIGPIGVSGNEGHCTGTACPGISYFVHVNCVWIVNAYPRAVKVALVLPTGPFALTLEAATEENFKGQVQLDKCQSAYDKQTGWRSRIEAMRGAGAEIPPAMLKDLDVAPAGCPPPPKVDPEKPIARFSMSSGIIGKSAIYELRLKVNGGCVARRGDIKSFSADFAAP